MNKMMLKKQYLMHNTKKKGGLPSRLPSGFQEVEYIESTGTQYIDTLLNVSSGMRFVSDFKFTRGGTTRYNPIMGTQIDSYPWNGCFLRYTTEYNAFEFAGYINRIPISIGTKYNVDYTYTPTKLELRLDGVLKDQQTLNVSITDYSMYLMGFHNGGSHQISFLAVYTAKFYINGELVREFIPCYRKSDNEVGLYDIVGNQFYTNQGSGTFLKGADV